MSNTFGVQKTSVFGSFGEFTIGDDSNTIRAKYILTKIRPGNEGTPECLLASQMMPWREVFNVEELSFDELLQRDLDDSRVAHDLIPYLLGESGNRAKFFPPILAVIVPRKQVGAGIKRFYPKPKVQEKLIEKYGELFDFEQLKWGEQATPLASLSYNSQRSAFIIVDGQHRAMAVLALHRQLTNTWGDKPFAPYYDHISVTPKQVKSIELPTCIIYFPDLHEGNLDLQKKGIDLSSICREIFIVVNRSAKRVSESRELLLDDEDIAAHLMRQTLSTLKNRGEEHAGSARIYSISYEDSDTKIGQKEVVSGRLKYSSAIALHKIHRAVSFGAPEAFKIDDYHDISDGRRTQNKNRSPEILLGTDVDHLDPLEYNSGKSYPPHEVDEIVKKLGRLADKTLVNLFDKFRPFEIHNNELKNLKTRLSDPQARSQKEQKEAYTLIFEGSGVRNVFESHFMRLKEEKADHLQPQIKFCESVERTLNQHESIFQRRRACRFFSINYDLFYSEDNDNQSEKKKLEERARKLFQTISTQAFQLGYAMAIFTIVEELKRNQSDSSSFKYKKRRKLVHFVTEVYLTALNRYFSPQENETHRPRTGDMDILESRTALVFDANSIGLRGLLAMNVNELNERQWRFFRYAILEIIHSPICWDVAKEKMKQMDSKWALECYKKTIPRIVVGIISEREKKYVEDAVKAYVEDPDFENLRMRTESEARGAKKTEEQIRQSIEELQATRKADARKRALNHLKASLETIENEKDMVKRLRTGL